MRSGIMGLNPNQAQPSVPLILHVDIIVPSDSN
jgi:hypothetical protein